MIKIFLGFNLETISKSFKRFFFYLILPELIGGTVTEIAEMFAGTVTEAG